MQGGGRIAGPGRVDRRHPVPRNGFRSQALLRLPSGKEYVMSNGIAAGLGLASLVGLATALGPAQPDPLPATPRPSATIRSQVDAARGRIWWLTDAGLTMQDRTRRQPVTLRLPGWHWAGVPYGCPPDLALGPRGEVIVTSDVLPKLWRVDPETLAVTVHAPVLDDRADRDVGFSALGYSTRHGAYFAVGSTPGSLWRIDPFLSRAQETPLAAPRTRLCGLPSASVR
jgi:hypothetical protein